MDAGQVETQRQMLLTAQSQLEDVVASKLKDAIKALDHTAVLRFVRLHKPLGCPQKGLSKYIEYLRMVLGIKGRELYSELSETLDKGSKAAAAVAGAKGVHGLDFVSALTGLFKGVAMAVEQDEEVRVEGLECKG